MDDKPFFSIIIPTRNRHETLPFAIKTVLNQDFDNFEIVICDNCSSYETKEVIDSLNSPKIRYIRTDTPLSMSDNWELAVSKTQGDYILLFGDDDGIVPMCLSILYRLIQHTKARVIRWTRAYYSWGDLEPSIFANNLTILFNSNSQWIDGKKAIQRVVNMEESYEILPMLYNSTVHKSIIEKVVAQKGRFFHSITPDLFSGYANAYFSEKYLSLGVPLSVNGGSKKSNGTASFYKEKNNSISNDFNSLNEQSNLRFHQSMPYIRSIPAVIFEPFAQLSDLFEILDIYIDLDILYDHILKSIISYTEQEKEEYIKELIRSGEFHSQEIRDKIDSFIPSMVISNLDFKISPKGIVGNAMNLDTLAFNIHDVFSSCQFVANFFNYDVEQIIRDIKPLEEISIISQTPTHQKLSWYRRIRSAARIIIRGE